MKKYRVDVFNYDAGKEHSKIPFNDYDSAKIYAKKTKNKLRDGGKVFILESVTDETFDILEEVQSNFLNDANVEQLKIKYENAKQTSKENLSKGNAYDAHYEYGKAEALESVLRMLGYNYTEIASGRFLHGDKEEEK